MISRSHFTIISNILANKNWTELSHSRALIFQYSFKCMCATEGINITFLLKNITFSQEGPTVKYPVQVKSAVRYAYKQSLQVNIRTHIHTCIIQKRHYIKQFRGVPQCSRYFSGNCFCKQLFQIYIFINHLNLIHYVLSFFYRFE